MNRIALVFLEDVAARRMVASWEALDPRVASTDEDGEVLAWSLASGVERAQVRRLRACLLSNMIVGRDADGKRWVADLARTEVLASAGQKAEAAGG